MQFDHKNVSTSLKADKLDIGRKQLLLSYSITNYDFMRLVTYWNLDKSINRGVQLMRDNNCIEIILYYI